MIRIIWRFSRAEIRREDLVGEPATAVSDLGLDSFAEVSSVFQSDQEGLETELEDLDDPENDFARYFQAYAGAEAEARPILAALEEAQQQGRIEWFDVQGEIGPHAPISSLEAAPRIDCPPDPGGETPTWDQCQVYLGPSDPNLQRPSGVDARFAWGLKGGRGQRVGIVDVEGGWLLDHEDLEGRVSGNFGSSPSAPVFEAHGSAVLGILCAKPQDPPQRTMGVIGIAHHARIGVASFRAKAGKEPNPESVIKEASKWLKAGDVLLLELQASRQPGGPLLPIEAWPHGRAAIKYAHDRGIYVVEVAANGGLTLSPAAHDVPNSGLALMVGAGDIVTGKVHPDSNRGRRVDLQGWGMEVVTTGDALPPYSDLQARVRGQRCYTRSFSGTSSAGAIVAGCVAIISSIVKAHGLPVLTPEEMKGLLQQTGTFRNRAANGGIGPLPNVRAALEALESQFRRDHPDFQGFQRVGNPSPERAENRRSRRISVPNRPSNGQQDRRYAVAQTDRPTKANVQKAYGKALKKFGSRENVTGVDVGYKYEAGERTSETAIRIHVREKLDESVLEDAEIFPTSIDGIPVDVIEAEYKPQAGIQANGRRRQRMDPIQPGISCGHRSVSAGTLGAVVYDRVSGKRAILSNWHILVGPTTGQAGDPILQPGSADGGRFPGDNFASLERWILDSNGDAAVALLNGSRSVLDEQIESKVGLHGARLAEPGDVVEKSGRTTGVTRGLVDGTGRYFLDYGPQRVGIDGFKIVSRRPGNPDNEEISSGGDSGSIWYIPGTEEAVGLHFAGEINSRPEEEHALACHVPRVLDALDISLRPIKSKETATVAHGKNGHERQFLDWLDKNRSSLAELGRILGGMSPLPGDAPQEDACPDSDPTN